MKKEIVNYLHLYLGCEVQTEFGIGALIEVRRDPTKKQITGIKRSFCTDECRIAFAKRIEGGTFSKVYSEVDPSPAGNATWLHISKMKLLLRPLSDMTEEELFEFKKIDIGKYPKAHDLIRCDAERVKYLLSKGFDLFNLIEANLAEDKTKLEI